MFGAVKRWWIKDQFRDLRAQNYETLIEELSKDGARRTETISATFEAWAARDRARKRLVAAAYGAIAARMNVSGMSFADALSDLVPLEERLLIGAGEQSGNLAGGIDHAIKVKSAFEKMKDAVREATLLPLLQALGVIATSVAFGIQLWPDLLSTFPIEYFADWAKPGIYMDLWLAKNWPLLALIILFAGVYYVSLPRWTGRSRQFFDRLPPWSSYRDQTAIVVLTSLAGYLANGLVITDACKLIRDRAPPYMRWHMNRIIPAIEAQENALEAFYTGLFSRAILDRLQDARRTRDLETTIVHVGFQALSGLVSLVQRNAATVNLIGRSAIAAMLFYTTAIQLIAVQDATDKYSTAVTRGLISK